MSSGRYLQLTGTRQTTPMPIPTNARDLTNLFPQDEGAVIRFLQRPEGKMILQGFLTDIMPRMAQNGVDRSVVADMARLMDQDFEQVYRRMDELAVRMAGIGPGGSVVINRDDYLYSLAREMRTQGVKLTKGAPIRFVRAVVARNTAAAPGTLTITNPANVPVVDVIRGKGYLDDPDLVVDSVNTIRINGSAPTLSIYGVTTPRGAADWRYQQSGGGGFSAFIHGFPLNGKLTTFETQLNVNGPGDVSVMFMGAVLGDQVVGEILAEYDPDVECGCRW